MRSHPFVPYFLEVFVMRAFVLTEAGSAPTVAQLEVPEPDEGEVRVRVHAASLNGFDLAVAAGYLRGMMEHRYPVVLGKDFAGVVDAVGAGVTGYAPGDRVFGVVVKPYLGDGSFGEYVVVPVAVGLAKLPASVGFPEGAALGLAGTAALAAVDAAQLQPGQVVLVAGATGGVGTQVVQVAAKAGARVIATAHTDQERVLVTGLGASDVIDYTQDVVAQVRTIAAGGVDAVVHLAGDAASLLPVVRPGGRFVSTLLGTPDQLPAENLTVVPVAANPAPATLDRLARHQAEGTTRVVVQKIYALDATPHAAVSNSRRNHRPRRLLPDRHPGAKAPEVTQSAGQRLVGQHRLYSKKLFQVS
jgi:NADPH:quinone reductase-like Zn-dependent oxidoreductase